MIGAPPTMTACTTALVLAAMAAAGTVKAGVLAESRPRISLAANSRVMCVLGRNGSNYPRYSIWNGSSWGSNTSLPWSSGDDIQSVAATACPTRDEILFAMINDDKNIRAVAYNGTSWTGWTLMTSDGDQKDRRPFDVAYECSSGDGMVVYWNENSNHFAYRTWNGSSFSSEVLMTGSGASYAHFISLTANPSGDQIILLCQDHNSDTRLLARVWSGSSWSSWTVLTTDMPSSSRETCHAAWERVSGRGFVAYGENGSNSPRYRTWNGTSWSSESSAPSIGSEPRWIRLASDPASNTILMVASDSSDDVEANVWNGSSWGSNQQFENDTNGDSKRRFDVAFEPGSSNAICVYREKNKNRPQYRTWNGSSWSSEQDGTNFNRKTDYVQLCPGLNAGEVFICVGDDSNDLHLMRWNGSSMSGNTQIENDYGGGSDPACIVAASASVTKKKVVSWAEVEPD